MKTLVATLFWLLCLTATGLAAQETTNTLSDVIYDYSSQASTSVGYRDNVLYSSVTQENSPFSKMSFDTSMMRISDSGSLLVLYLLGEDTRYWGAQSDNYEQLVCGSVQYITPVGERDEVGLAADYLYLHQILDASDTQADLYRVLVEGHSVTLSPHWKHIFGNGWAAQVKAGAQRQTYRESLDDYSEALGKMSLIYSYGNRSELSVGWQYLVRHYDTRTQTDPGGTSLADTRLRYYQNEFSSRWRHNWDSDRHWQTTTRFSALFNRDNGSGYFDYNRLLLRQQVRWNRGNWSASAAAGLGWYLYKTQRIDADRREHSYTVIDARIERKISARWRLYVAAEREWNMSNDPLNEFRGWMASAGLTFEF
jgi:hypothetical protein